MKIITGLILSAFGAVVIVSAVSTTSQNLSGSTAQSPAQATPAKKQADAQQTADSAPAAPTESKWVSHYGEYYVTCYVTGGVRWYTAINQSNLNDAQVNQTPSDDEWMQMCGSG
jgi:hypothetical protein